MKLAKVTRAVVAAGLAVACLGGIAACSSGSGSGSTGGVAATVNGTAIQEDRVTDMIQGIRAQYGLDEADAWGQYLAAYGMTPESIREQMVDSFVNRELVKLAAEEKGMSVDASEVQSYVDTMRANYGLVIARSLPSLCVAAAAGGWHHGYDMLADLGFLNAETIVSAIDAVVATGNVAATAYLINLKEKRWGAHPDYSL